MDISGADTVIPGTPSPNEDLFIVRWLRAEWPDFVLDDSSATERYEFEGLREFFVYQTRVDLEAWKDSGFTEETEDTMIHFVIGEKSTTIVSAGPGFKTHDLAIRLRDAIILHRKAREAS